MQKVPSINNIFYFGGGNKGSIAVIITFYTRFLIIFVKIGPFVSRQGLEFAYIKKGLRLLSSIKSSPNN